MATLYEKIAQIYAEPDPVPYAFEIGQLTRVRIGRSEDGQTPAYWDGADVRVEGRYTTGL